MTKTIEQRIDEQDVWTFSDCLGLAAEYGAKVRMVIVMVYARGKTYVERDLKTDAQGDVQASSQTSRTENEPRQE